ncbi:MAG: hypothetical protein NWE91_00535 [Candidatus Bathyarchaeota archaeon]|nr:hypothetical protein [Candidatus Bathyarchaeota archaeon]
MTTRKQKPRQTRNAEEKLESYELLLYEEALKLDKKRKTLYIQ